MPREAKKGILRLLAAGREVRTTVRGLTHDSGAATMLKTEGVERGAGAPFIAAEFDHHAERLDAAAGCEYVDDQIRRPG